ncbi:response regulator transcription factor [Patescibacteria group bacterium]|nr:response regulator transcription factor [Patescibacteria group bacterium]
MEEKKVLLVEDDSALSGALIAKLNAEGFLTLLAKNGEEGLDLAFDNHPDLILLDIIMPKMDGVTMLKKLRLDTWGKDVPVIVMSNLSEADKNIDIVDADIQAYLVKSDFPLADIVEKIKSVLHLS